jgi:hypothetical protein
MPWKCNDDAIMHSKSFLVKHGSQLMEVCGKAGTLDQSIEF